MGWVEAVVHPWGAGRTGTDGLSELLRRDCFRELIEVDPAHFQRSSEGGGGGVMTHTHQLGGERERVEGHFGLKTLELCEPGALAKILDFCKIFG